VIDCILRLNVFHLLRRNISRRDTDLGKKKGAAGGRANRKRIPRAKNKALGMTILDLVSYSIHERP
jgi:hypothetical protein